MKHKRLKKPSFFTKENKGFSFLFFVFASLPHIRQFIRQGIENEDKNQEIIKKTYCSQVTTNFQVIIHWDVPSHFDQPMLPSHHHEPFCSFHHFVLIEISFKYIFFLFFG
jgi:hypothetical protein